MYARCGDLPTGVGRPVGRVAPGATGGLPRMAQKAATSPSPTSAANACNQEYGTTPVLERIHHPAIRGTMPPARLTNAARDTSATGRQAPPPVPCIPSGITANPSNRRRATANVAAPARSGLARVASQRGAAKVLRVCSRGRKGAEEPNLPTRAPQAGEVDAQERVVQVEADALQRAH